MSEYLKFLLTLLLLRACDSKTINVIMGSNQRASRVRQKGKKEGHIKETSIKEEKRTCHVVKLFSLSRKGFEFLMENLPEELVFASDTVEINGFTSMISGDRHRDAYLRIANCAQTMGIAARSGCVIPGENFAYQAGEIGGKSSYLHLAGQAGDDLLKSIGFLPYMENEYPSDGNERFVAVYHSAAFLKNTVGSGTSQLSKTDFSSGRYAGVVDSREKTILLYGSPLFGFRWHNTLCFREEAALTQWLQLYTSKLRKNPMATGLNAAMIVKNPRQFAALYTRKDETDKQKQTDKLPFGGNFDHFYILPLSTDAGGQLRMILSTQNDYAALSAFAKEVVSGGYTIGRRSFKANHFNADGLFPLVDSQGNFTALAQFMDACHFSKIERKVQKTQRRFSLICFEWQAPYYAAILPPNVDILTF